MDQVVVGLFDWNILKVEKGKTYTVDIAQTQSARIKGWVCLKDNDNDNEEMVIEQAPSVNIDVVSEMVADDIGGGEIYQPLLTTGLAICKNCTVCSIHFGFVVACLEMKTEEVAVSKWVIRWWKYEERLCNVHNFVCMLVFIWFFNDLLAHHRNTTITCMLYSRALSVGSTPTGARHILRILCELML